MHEGIEHAVTSVSTKASYASSGGLILFGYFDAQEFGIYCGIGIGLLTFLVTLIFRIRDDKRKIRADKRHDDWIKAHTPLEKMPTDVYHHYD